MTAVTVTELSVTDIPIDLKYGTAPKRRAIVAIRYTSAGTSDTLNLATYVPGVADIEGIMWDTMNSAVTGTAATWSSLVLTSAGDAGSHIGEIGLLVNFS